MSYVTGTSKSSQASKAAIAKHAAAQSVVNILKDLKNAGGKAEIDVSDLSNVMTTLLQSSCPNLKLPTAIPDDPTGQGLRAARIRALQLVRGIRKTK